jgi:hypothetical protein
MCRERHSNRKDLHVKVRPADLDAPTLVDRISADLLDHLIVCRTCSVIFAAQEHSLGEVGCVEGRRTQCAKTIEERETLALGSGVHRRRQWGTRGKVNAEALSITRLSMRSADSSTPS